ncbi:protein NRT1/ PTR FAMILY 4.5-like isoform X2 [Momordica charantia]|nr:protein NRT1/ PTR FAMILY 4.5-like isoform X2 [Momordica charantia]
MAFVSLALSLVTYFSGYMNFSLTKSATTLTNFMGTTFLLTLLGGFISDTYLSRFKTCLIFASIEFMGYGLLTAQAHFRELRPAPCKGAVARECEAADGGQEAILYLGIYLIALGTSGVKSALPALGADQFDGGDPAEAGKLSSFFNWFLFSLTTGSIVGLTLIVWINTDVGWDWAFVVCSLAVVAAIVAVCSGKKFYRNNAPKGSPIQRIFQVFVASIRNRKLPLPKNADELHEIRDKEAAMPYEILEKTDQFRFLDRAAIIRNYTSASMAAEQQGPWRLCTVTQVEETKILIRMLPIIVSTIFMATCMAQLQTFSIQQSITMDSNFLGFKIPGPSVPVIPLLFMCFLIPFYERVFVPLARKITGIPTGIRHLQRIGIGLVLTAASMAIAGFVETRRKNIAIEHDMVDSEEPLPMSVFWLSFQFCIFGMGDMFTLVGLLEFFYAESSAGMKSLSTAIAWCSIAFGYFTSTVVVEVVNKASGGWLESNNLNRDKLNYFYWLLSVLSVLNFGFYLMCASWYRYKNVEILQNDTEEEKDDIARGA